MSDVASSTNVDRPRILICDPIHETGVALLQQHAHVDVVDKPKLTEDELSARIANYHAVINRSRTAIPAAAIRRGEHLRVIARAGVGLDNIDVTAAQEMGIDVINAPNANTVAVAEHTFSLMLGLARHLSRADESMKAGQWDKSHLLGVSLAGKTLGIIGFGRIGREVAKRAKAFAMNVVVNQTRWTPELAQEWRVENVDLLDLLAQADFVTIHVPMRAANMGLLTSQHFTHMKPTAYLINTARGGIVDEDALLAALDNKQIAGAGLDVFAGEPNYRPELASHPRVLATPHIGASTEEAQRKAAMDVAEGVLAILQRPSVAEALGLRIVPTDEVMLHEDYHPPRVARLAERVLEDGILSNPPLVTALKNGQGYVVLDGATRSAVFKQLGYPHIVVQVVDIDRDNVQLFSWNHAVCGNGAEELLDLVRNISGLHLTEMTPTQLRETMRNRNALGCLITAQKQGYLLDVDGPEAGRGLTGSGNGQRADEHDWLDVLNRLIADYGQWGDIERTLHTNIDELRAMYTSFAGLFVFPTFTPDVVLQMAGQGRRLPAGITRFVIPGRILRLNAPLDVLADDQPLSLKHDWLDRFMQEKLGARQVRYYEEPVTLLDE